MKQQKIVFAIALAMICVFTTPSVYAIEPTDTVSATTSTQTPRPTKVAGNLREATLVRAKTLAKSIYNNHFLTKLNALRAKISSNERLGAEAKAVLLSKIDEEIMWFTEKRESIESLTTPMQVRESVKVARMRFLQLGKELRRLHIARGFVVSLERIANNLEKNTLPKIEAKLQDLSSKSVDVTAEQALLVSAKAELELVKKEITEIKNSTTYEAAKKNFDEAKAHLKKVRQSLKDILTSLKAKLQALKEIE